MHDIFSQIKDFLREHSENAKERFLDFSENNSVFRVIFAVLIGVTLLTVSFFIFKPGTTTNTSSQTAQKTAAPTVTAAQNMYSVPDRGSVYGLERSLRLASDIQKSIVERGNTYAVQTSRELLRRVPEVSGDESNIFIRHINAIRSLRNYATINTIDLMNSSYDRVSTLNDYLAHLGQAEQATISGINELSAEVGVLNSELQQHNGAITTYNQSIGKNLQNLDPNATVSDLDRLIQERNVAGEVSTKKQVLTSIYNYYKAILPKVQLKIKVITANREALIKGVTVVNIKGMEEDLILSEQEWASKLGK